MTAKPAADHIAGVGKMILTALAATLAGCASPQPYAPADPVRAQCEYEAEVAIQAIPNPLYAGYRKGELIQMCLRAKGR